ncbi:MAG: anaerobic ribonucleoside-triphosphate reductase [Candidatus Margulisbacteria bacterium]|nr:anaerobic ribonucleoside-triphosphate reductase [Candidatus Margulisiibacteriota bacterium]
MRNIKEIEKEIETLKSQLNDVKGTPTEVYSRIVGYYRPVQNWNNGKRSEYGERVEFNIKEKIAENQKITNSITEVEKPETGNDFNIVVNDRGVIKKYKLFYSDNCPGCPPVKNYLKQVQINGEEINANTKEGFEEAIKNNVTGTPTVLFLNDSGEVVNVAHTPSQIELLIA